MSKPKNIQRKQKKCRWEYIEEGVGVCRRWGYAPGCMGKTIANYCRDMNFCPYCGKRIEVKK